jgi:zinc protease
MPNLDLSVRRADPDFADIRAMNYILGGGGFVSRLTRSIREEQGLAYSVFSDFVGGSQFPGFFSAGLQTKIDTTSQALKSLLAVIDGMKQQPVSVAELTDMKLYYEGSLPRRAESYGQVAGLLLDREFFGLPDGYWESEIRQIQQLTPQKIQQLAQRYLDTDNFVLALVSKRQQLDLADAPIPSVAIRYVLGRQEAARLEIVIRCHTKYLCYDSGSRDACTTRQATGDVGPHDRMGLTSVPSNVPCDS